LEYKKIDEYATLHSHGLWSTLSYNGVYGSVPYRVNDLVFVYYLF